MALGTKLKVAMMDWVTTQLSKKADGSGVMRWRGSLTQADFDSASSQQSYSGWVASDITGGPYAAYANVWGLASGTSNHDTQFWADMNRVDALFFRQGTTALGYSPWNRIGTDTPPQWLDAPLEAGWTHINANDGLKYGRDSRGLLWLRGGVRPTSLAYDSLCCTLPPGYRSDVQQWVDTISSVGTQRTFRIASNGKVSMLLGSTTLQSNEYILFKTTSFPCAL